MCLGIPAQVVELIDAELQLAKVDVSGIQRTVNVALLDGEVEIGDWVLLHVGQDQKIRVGLFGDELARKSDGAVQSLHRVAVNGLGSEAPRKYPFAPCSRSTA